MTPGTSCVVVGFGIPPVLPEIPVKVGGSVASTGDGSVISTKITAITAAMAALFIDSPPWQLRL